MSYDETSDFVQMVLTIYSKIIYPSSKPYNFKNSLYSSLNDFLA
jgi:hypothetical protein